MEEARKHKEKTKKQSTVNIMIFKKDVYVVLSDSVVPGSQEEHTANSQIG